MNRTEPIHPICPVTVPRTRGDEPLTNVRSFTVDGRSPHARG